MTLLQLLAALLPVVSVFLLLRATLWDRSTEPAPMALLVALAIGIGFAVSSCTFFLSLLLFDGARLGVIAIDLALLLLAAVAAWRRPGRPQARVPHPSSPRDRLLVAAVLAAALTGAIAFFINTLEDPHGQWDAWMTWNLRARALVRAGPAWRTLFAPPTVHGDYPLMVPAAVARIWVYGGAEDPSVPAALAAAYAGAIVLLIYGALAALRGQTAGLLGALCLLGTPLFLRSAPWQYADIPLAFCVLAAVALLAMHDYDPACGRSVLAWAGFATGMAAWAKNEGMLFVLCVVAARTVIVLVRREPIRVPVTWFVAGLLPAAAVVLSFKIAFSPPSYLATQPRDHVVSRIADTTRYLPILRAVGFEGARGCGALLLALAIYLALVGRSRDQRARRSGAAAALVVALVALGYGAVYVITPAKISWLLEHSLDRLILHLWPSVLLAFFLYAASATDLVAPAPAVAREARPVRAAPSRRTRSAPTRARRR
jgi:hypothetical protein